MRLAEFLEDAFSEVVKLGGKLVSREHYEARVKACRACEFVGEVEPGPNLKMEGCTLCGCPLKTKPYFDRFLVGGKEITCPHPEGSRWAEIDSKFKTEQ